MNRKLFTTTGLFVLLLAACGVTENPDQITLRYAAWNLGIAANNNIERQMLAEYEKDNPHVNIEIIERLFRIDEETGAEVALNWEEFFATQAAINSIPDVYTIADLSGFTAQGWTEELTDLFEADEDFLKIPEDIRATASYNDRYFAIPQSIFYFGFFINRTAINRVGPRAVMPTYGMTYEALMSAAEKNSKAPIQGGDGIIGISGLGDLVNWLPAQLNPELGWFTFNEETGYHLDSPAFATAVTEQAKYYGAGKAAYGNYVLDSLDPARYSDYFGASSNIFETGNQSIRFEGSYAMRDWHTRSLDPNDSLFGADIDFIGTPSWNVEGVGNVNKIPLVVDYLAVGKGTKHREEAYNLSRWMGFSVDGYAKRLELAKADPTRAALNFTPMIPQADLVEEFFALYPNMTEFRKIVENHEDFIFESIGKNVPGYWDSRVEAVFDSVMVEGVEQNRTVGQVITDIVLGNISLADALEKKLNDIVNEQWIESKEALDTYLNTLT